MWDESEQDEPGDEGTGAPGPEEDLALAFALSRASRRLERMVLCLADSPALPGRDLEDVYALDRLSGNYGASISAVAEHLGVRGQTASERLARLARAGLVEYVQHPVDSRAFLVGLTARGREVLHRAREAVHQALDHVADELELASLEQGRRDLDRGGVRLVALGRDAAVIGRANTLQAWWAGSRAIAGPSRWTSGGAR